VNPCIGLATGGLKVAGVGTATIQRLEKSHPPIAEYFSTLVRIQAAFERAGDDDEAGGIGVRRAKKAEAMTAGRVVGGLQRTRRTRPAPQIRWVPRRSPNARWRRSIRQTASGGFRARKLLEAAQPAPDRSRASFRRLPKKLRMEIGAGPRPRRQAPHHPGSAAPRIRSRVATAALANEEVARRTRLGAQGPGAWAGLRAAAARPLAGDRAERDAPPSACAGPVGVLPESGFASPSDRGGRRSSVTVRSVIPASDPLQPCCPPALPCNAASFSLLFS
jgi:hypothetical protein